jgi:hypothetical protein
MKAKHTPGPWAWVYDGSSDYSIGEAEDPQAKAVAGVYAWGRDYDTAEANCALIAAAPDLLAALKELVAHSSCRAGDVPMWQAAEAAIAKAEGRDAKETK